MKKLFKNYKYVFIIVVISTFFNCGGGSRKKTIKWTNVLGAWHHSHGEMVGRYYMSTTKILNIIRNGPGDYEYIVEETIYDAAYGNKPRSYRSQGSFIYEPGNKKWIFKGGDWGERGAHINVPYDGWENEPKQLTVFFPVNRGRPTLFERNSN